MESSPACWAAYGEVLAREYSDPAYFQVHRLSVGEQQSCERPYRDVRAGLSVEQDAEQKAERCYSTAFLYAARTNSWK